MRAMRGLLLVAVLVLTACGGTQGPPASHTTSSGSGAGSDMVCHEETPTGSSFSRTVCRTREQADEDRKGADDMLRQQGSRPGAPN